MPLISNCSMMPAWHQLVSMSGHVEESETARKLQLYMTSIYQVHSFVCQLDYLGKSWSFKFCNKYSTLSHFENGCDIIGYFMLKAYSLMSNRGRSKNWNFLTFSLLSSKKPPLRGTLPPARNQDKIILVWNESDFHRVSYTRLYSTE